MNEAADQFSVPVCNQLALLKCGSRVRVKGQGSRVRVKGKELRVRVKDKIKGNTMGSKGRGKRNNIPPAKTRAPNPHPSLPGKVGRGRLARLPISICLLDLPTSLERKRLSRKPQPPVHSGLIRSKSLFACKFHDALK